MFPAMQTKKRNLINAHENLDTLHVLLIETANIREELAKQLMHKEIHYVRYVDKWCKNTFCQQWSLYHLYVQLVSLLTANTILHHAVAT